MFIYRSDVAHLIQLKDEGRLVIEVKEQFNRLKGSVGERELMSWMNSLPQMVDVIEKSGIPSDCGVLIEYVINATGKRVDFIVSGQDDSGRKNLVIVELKQWQKVETTYVEDVFNVAKDDGVKVNTYTGGAMRSVVHPSYQAMTYKQYLQDMNEEVYSGRVSVQSCSYLHNYVENDPEPLRSYNFNSIIEDTPVFFTEDKKKLEKFIKTYVGKGKGVEILYEIENGKIKPSKKLIDYVNQIIEHNPTYVLLDEQKIAYSSIVKYALYPKKKTVILVNGGPGTGKSVVAVLAMSRLLEAGKNVRFVTPNQAFREALTDSIIRKEINGERIKSLFIGSSRFYDCSPNYYDAIIVDEAHRLRSPGAYMYNGTMGQVWDVVNAAQVSVFFVDDDQRIRPNDEGTVDRIKQVAGDLGAECLEVHLDTQFRCSGASDYIDWIERALQLKAGEKDLGWRDSYRFQVFDDPNQLYGHIMELNGNGYSARMLAGFAWRWYDSTKADGVPKEDVYMDEFDFHHSWNDKRKSFQWAIDDSMQDEIGCIHTSQGLEFDYVGVILGNDIKFDRRTGRIYADYDEYKDTSGKKGLRNDPEGLTRFVKNIYKVLMSRGIYGCFIFCRDKALSEYFHSLLGDA